MFSTPLIGAEQSLELQRQRRHCVILDTGFDLADADAGERDWRGGHVPNSFYLHLDRDLCGAKTGRNGRHPLPERSAFALTLGRLGIAPDTPVVVLDRQGSVYAARAWWTMRWMGHRKVAVLDGGFSAWVQAGGIPTTQVCAPSSEPPYPEQAPQMPTLEADTLARSLGQVRLIDARAAERFRGEVEPLDARAGHIPGALNRYFKHNLSPEGRFNSAEQLRNDFLPLLAEQGADQVVHQCGSGVTACHNLLAMEIAGLHGSRLYPGSWSEWSADPIRPVAVG